MNFFEQELKKLFGDGKLIDNPSFSGRACFGTLGKELRVRIQFHSGKIGDHFDSLKITILNRSNGPVDALTLKLKDLWGMKPVPGNLNFRDGIAPYIWIDGDQIDWYVYHPTQADREVIRQAAGEYLNVFREQSRDREQDGPKLVYICAPLLGDVEKNIAFAKEKAREVFESGDVPVCSHLLFPPIAGANDPVQDQTAREMGLKLVESCQQINVYGPVWTDGMWAEIHHAEKFGIPVMTDQKTIGRSPKQAARKREQR